MTRCRHITRLAPTTRAACTCLIRLRGGNPMRIAILPFIALAALLYGCGAAKPDPAAAQAPMPKPAPGEVVLAADSPKLREIKVESVTTAETPSDEVGSPGKVDVNPNRLAHVLLPLQVRIEKVYVKLGDAVRQGQTLLSLESPDADLAM